MAVAEAIAPSPDEQELARAIIVDMLEAETKRLERSLRHQLRSLVVSGLKLGIDYNLSDGSTPLGELMAKANARAKEMGWL